MGLITDAGIQRIGFTIFGSVFFAVGAAAVVSGRHKFIKGRMTQQWPSTEGTITESRILREKGDGDDSMTTYFYPEIHYSYAVNRVSYLSAQVRLDGYAATNYGYHAQHVVDRYRAGQTVRVFYDPASPDQSVLEPGVHWQQLTFFPVGAALLIIAVILFVSA